MSKEHPRKSTRKGKPVARLGDSPEPSPPSSPSSAPNHNLIVRVRASSGLPIEPEPHSSDDSVPDSASNHTRPWQAYTRLTLYEYWSSAKQVVSDLKLANSSLRRTLKSKDRELGLCIRRLQSMQTGLGDMANTRMALDRVKSEKRDLGTQLEAAKSSRVEVSKKCKESLSELKERHKLSVATLNVKHQAEVGKGKLELAKLGILVSARDGTLKQQEIRISELLLKSKKYDEFQAMDCKSKLMNQAYMDRAEIR